MPNDGMSKLGVSIPTTRENARKRVAARPGRCQTNPLAHLMVKPLLVTLRSGRELRIQCCSFSFQAGPPIPSLRASHGKKPVLKFNGERVVAEIAVLRLLQEAGWDGVWVDSWRKKYRASLPRQFCELPTHAQELLNRISGSENWPRGCWDIFAWKNGKYLFVECKRKKKDSLTEPQKEWLNSALNVEIPQRSFIVFEWDLE